MRCTVRIDDDLIETLRARSEDEGLSMTDMLNRLLRSGLDAETDRPSRMPMEPAVGARGRSEPRA